METIIKKMMKVFLILLFLALCPSDGFAVSFDVFSFAMAVRNDPAAYGFINATEPSPNFDVPNNFDGTGHVF